MKTFLQLLVFLSRKPNTTCVERERLARRRALEIVEKLDLEPDLFLLRQAIVHIYQKGLGAKAVERCAHRTCHQIGEVLKTTHFEDDRMGGKLSEISRNCSEGV